MIKRTSIGNENILSVKVIEDLNNDDMDWLTTLIDKKANDDKVQNILLYIEFEDFADMSIENMIKYFKLFISKGHNLMQRVSRAAAITDDTMLANKLALEFSLLPSTKFKSYKPEHKENALQWLRGDELVEPV
ncbi:STAS/SEC14 domain-containing protein [Nonlabens ponticola]|uniref:STAS/SEC14 domain-containing protein n=1 Tax=Nonlabens ponticola TaxID=2496866 RepID=A0A3S9MYZ5_9FLAO|nr:STAS/SEC14 domain-containing protein [Nonlabens ponticola]AZQ44486.1 STAS/SEC14 domain-containing protein [Nonlabens ponticola]